MRREQQKSLYDYKLGEINPKNMMNGLMKAPNKLVKIAYTFQSKKWSSSGKYIKT